MKQHYIYMFFLLMTAVLACSSGSISDSANASPLFISKTVSDSLIYDTIEVWQDSVWLDIEKKWTEEAFNPCLKKHKIKISCGTCIGVYMELNFYIGSNGKMDKYEVLRSRFCEKTSLESCMMDYFKQITFPPQYYKKTFKTRIGRYLKC